MAACLADGSAGDFALGDDRADVVFGTIGVERNFGAVEDAQQVGLLLAQAAQQLVEQREAGDAAEDAVEPRAHRRRPFRMRRSR